MNFSALFIHTNCFVSLIDTLCSLNVPIGVNPEVNYPKVMILVVKCTDLQTMNIKLCTRLQSDAVSEVSSETLASQM